MYFWNYGLRNTWLDQSLKSPVSEDGLTGNILNGPKYCLKFSAVTFIMFLHHSDGIGVGKCLPYWYLKSHLMFIKTLYADDKYSLRSSENVRQPNQLQFSKKQNNLSQFFASFLKSTSNFGHFEQKDDAYRLCIFGIMDCVNVVK